MTDQNTKEEVNMKRLKSLLSKIFKTKPSPKPKITEVNTSFDTDLVNNQMLKNFVYLDTKLANETIKQLNESGLLDNRLRLRNLEDLDQAIITNFGHSKDEIRYIYNKSLQVYSRNIPRKVHLLGNRLVVGGLDVKTEYTD